MLQAIGSAGGLNIDAEYLRIMQELRRLGLTSTGNKDADAQRLAQAKAELIDRIKNSENQDRSQSLGVQVVGAVDEAENAKRSEMEEQRLGAMNVAQLNRIFFGL